MKVMYKTRGPGASLTGGTLILSNNLLDIWREIINNVYNSLRVSLSLHISIQIEKFAEF